MFEWIKDMSDKLIEEVKENYLILVVTILLPFASLGAYGCMHHEAPKVTKEEIVAPPKVILGCSDVFQLKHSDAGFRVIKDKETGYEYIIVYTNNGIAIIPRKGIIPRKDINTRYEEADSGKEK